MDKRQTSHASKSMANRLQQVQLDEQSNPLFDSKPFSPTIRKDSQQIAPLAEKGGVNTIQGQQLLLICEISSLRLQSLERPSQAFTLSCFSIQTLSSSATTSLPRCGLLRKIQTGSRNETCRTSPLRSKVNDVLLISTSLHSESLNFALSYRDSQHPSY
jgi:hypothetical protein